MKIKGNKNSLEDKLNFDISNKVLDDLISLFFQKNSLITKELYKNLNSLIQKINRKQFKDEESLDRIFLLNHFLSNFLNENTNMSLLISDIKENKNFKRYRVILKKQKNVRLSDEEIISINRYINDRLNYFYYFKYNPEILELATKFESRTYSSLASIIKKYNNLVEKIHNHNLTLIQKNKFEANDFSLENEEKFELMVDKTIQLAREQKKTIRTGLKYFNEVLNGGYKAKNLYVFLAVPGRFKSGILLNSCIWAVKYNKKIKASDPTKKPVVLYLTLENDVEETIERIYSYVKGDKANISEENPKSVMKAIREELRIKEGEIDIEIKYRPNKTISADDIKNIIDQMAFEENKEVVMLAVDYIRRMIPSNLHEKTADQWQIAGMVTDDLCVLAKTYEIPVITAGQLNRKAEEVLDLSENKNKLDGGKQLSRSTVSESRQIIENPDRVFLLNLEETPEGSYLTFKDVKSRKKKQQRKKQQYFVYPFRTNNGMRLKEDLEKDKSYHKFAIADGLADIFDKENKSEGNKKNKSELNNKDDNLDGILD
jgi:hypothetical protein